MTAFNVFVPTHLNACKVLSLSLLKPILYLPIEFGMVGFERQHIIGIGNVFWAAIAVCVPIASIVMMQPDRANTSIGQEWR